MSKNVVLLTPPSHSHRTAEENLGVGYVASALRQAGHHVVVVDGWLLDLTVDEILQRIVALGSAELIGISCYISSIEDVGCLIRSLKNAWPGVPIVGGGYGPTFHSKEFLDVGCDYVLCGEAERSMVDLLAALGGNQSMIMGVPGLVFRDTSGEIKRNAKVVPVENLDALFFPARDSINATIALKNPIHLSTSRGCMAHCLFCSVVSFGKTMKQVSSWRSRSIQNIVEEINSLYHEFGVTCYKIVDDSFIEPPRDDLWVRDFAEALQRRNLAIRFRTQVRADRLTESLVGSLVDAGWFATSVGIENGSPSALKRMNKSATLEDNKEALSLLQRHHIYVQMGMILFDHATTMAELRENFDFLGALQWPVTKGIFTEMFAAEGTPFTKLLINHGRIIASRNGNYQYRRDADSVELVYRALKAWHRSHSEIYDHAINPISAPKDLSALGYEAYHGICLSLYRSDLNFFGEILAFVEHSRGAIDDFVNDRIRNSVPYFEQIQRSLSRLDAMYGVSYIATPNKFL
jgi:hypothetical protein